MAVIGGVYGDFPRFRRDPDVFRDQPEFLRCRVKHEMRDAVAETQQQRGMGPVNDIAGGELVGALAKERRRCAFGRGRKNGKQGGEGEICVDIRRGVERIDRNRQIAAGVEAEDRAFFFRGDKCGSGFSQGVHHEPCREGVQMPPVDLQLFRGAPKMGHERGPRAIRFAKAVPAWAKAVTTEASDARPAALLSQSCK